MKTKAPQQSKRRRAFAYKTRRRLKVSLWFGWRKRQRKSALPPVESRRRGRSREDQITIEVLRYRLDHPDAVTKSEGKASYSNAFKSFILSRFEAEAEKFNHRQFARAAVMPAVTLRLWLMERRQSLLAEFEAQAAQAQSESFVPSTPEKKRARSFRETIRAIQSWVIEGLRPEPILAIGFHPYGGIELKQKRQRYTMIGFVCAAILHVVGIGIYWATLEKGETLQTVKLLRYIELPQIEIEEPRKEPKRANDGGGGGGEPGVAPAGNSNVVAVAENFVPMSDVAVIQDEIAQLVQSGMPALPGRSTGTPFGNIVASSNPLALPDLKFGTNGYSSNSSTDPSGLGLPQGFSGQGQGYTPGLASAKVGYGGGGTGGGGKGGYTTGRGSGPGAVNRIGTGPGSGGGDVTRVTAEDLKKTRTNVDLNIVFGELTDWMSEHQVELPQVLKHYMRYNPGYLTSKVTIEALPTSYDLFLLANKESQDIGLLLVSKDETSHAILLRDTGFRKKSFTLHQGTAGRDDDSKDVMSLSMSEENPSKEKTDHFYRIFLAWWEHRPKGVQTP